MKDGNSLADDRRHLERRAARTDHAEAQRDALVAQCMRRFIAINEAVQTVRSTAALLSDSTSSRESVAELLEEIASGLERSNRARSTDTEEIVEVQVDGKERSLRAAGN